MEAKLLCFMLLEFQVFCWLTASTTGSKTTTTASTTPSYHEKVLYASKTFYELSASLFSEFALHTEIIESHEESLNRFSQFSDGDFGDNTYTHTDTGAKNALVPETCMSKQLSLILRHGSRFPSPGDIKRTAAFVEKLEHMHIQEKYSALKSWSNYFTFDSSRDLAKNGVKENVEIAHRHVNRYTQLFRSSVLSNVSTFEVVSSNKQRTIRSAEAFLQGMSDIIPLNLEDLVSQVRHRDDLLRFFERCHLFLTAENKDEIAAEFEAFLKGPEMEEAAKRVSLRMSGSENADLISAEDLRTIWVACAFEMALGESGYNSPWCEPLTSSESLLLEYAFDLKAYWKRSYGYILNYEMSCPLLANVYSNMREVSQNSSAPGVSLYFGHTETLLPIYSLLGLFRDDQPLLASNYALNKDRKFRLSFISPFASNIGFILYDCKEGPQSSHPDWPEKLDSLMLQILVNEQPVPLPFTNKHAISLKEFETHYYQQIHHCDFNRICQNPADKRFSLHEEL